MDNIDKKVIKFLYKYGLNSTIISYNKTHGKLNNVDKNILFNIDDKINNFLNDDICLYNYINISDPEYDFIDFEYKGIKKEPVFPLHFQLYGINKTLHLNNFSFSLRSKKNNRPIMINWGKMNYAGIKGLQYAVNNFMKNNVSFNIKRGTLAKEVMKIVFLGKDDELKNQEKLLLKTFEFNKKNNFIIKIKVYNEKQVIKQIYNHYYQNILEAIKHNGNIKNNLEEKELKQLVIKSLKQTVKNNEEYIEELCYMKIVVNGSIEFYDKLFDELQTFLNENNMVLEIKKIGKSYTYNELSKYMKNFLFFKESLLFYFRKLKITESYDIEKLKLDNMDFIRDFLISYKKNNEKQYKVLIKYIYEAFYFKYKEVVLNSFLTQTDLSNSLELIQDVFQTYLQTNEIMFDDMYITKIDADIIRYKKKEKENSNLKNISLFGIISQ